MFAYCTEALHLSEGEAYLRIAVARASREHPDAPADARRRAPSPERDRPARTSHHQGEPGDSSQAGHASIQATNRGADRRSGTPERRTVHDAATPGEITARDSRAHFFRSSADVSCNGVGSLRVAPTLSAPTASPSVAVSSAPGHEPTPSGMGMTVTSSPAHLLTLSPDASSFSGPPSPNPPPSPPVVQPLAPGRYKVQFTATAALREKLARLQALMRSQVPDGDLGSIIEAAVTEKLERLEARRFAATGRPRKHLSTTETSPSSRRIPAAVRRAVHERDGGRCRYVDASGRRCSERPRLEYHHLHPFGLGGDHRPENIRLMCVQHNAYLAEHDYGGQAMDRFKRSGRPGTQRASGARPRAHGVATVASAGTAPGPAGVAPRGS